MSIGMTYDQYWNDDPTLVKHFRKAAEIKADRKNQELWLQGMYIYEALCCVSPVMRAFAKKGTKPIPYPDTPYALNSAQRTKEKETRKKKVYDKGKARMSAFMERVNAKFALPKEIDAERGEPDVCNN